MRKFFLGVLCVGVQSAAVADWSVTGRVDSMTDEIKKSAMVRNELGHTFSIYRITEGGPVWGNFALSDRVFDQVDWRKPPVYRVDKNKPNDLSRMRRMQEMGLGLHAYEWEPKWVNFLVWHGKRDDGLANDLLQLMEGNSVVFRYYLSTGGYKETSFSLNGAGPAIAEAIGISANIDHSAQQRTEEFKNALLAEVDQCRKDMNSFRECFARVNNCRDRSGQEVEKFKLCVQ